MTLRIFFVAGVCTAVLTACAGETHNRNSLPEAKEVPGAVAESDADSLSVAEIPTDKTPVSKDTLNTAVFESGANESVVNTPGGIRIEYIQRGAGESLQKGDVVRLKYQGKLPDGKVFESSDIIGQPLAFYIGVGMSLKGWDEALPLLRVGDIARVEIPSALAYGKRGYGKLIPPSTDLTYEMEVVDKMKPETKASGLKIYRTLLSSEGAKAAEGKQISIHYYGWLSASGKLFDSSHSSGAPYTFVLGKGKSIPGWTEALLTMKKGDKVILVVPPSLAYGEQGVPELVPPNSTLVYYLELINVTE